MTTIFPCVRSRQGKRSIRSGKNRTESSSTCSRSIKRKSNTTKKRRTETYFYADREEVMSPLIERYVRQVDFGKISSALTCDMEFF